MDNFKDLEADVCQNAYRPVNTNKESTPKEKALVKDLPDQLFLLGNICTGKDFLAARLISYAGYVKIGLADPIKDLVCDKHGISLDALEADKAKYRKELQEIGNGEREKDRDVWIKELIRKANMEVAEGKNIICTDVRHVNEARYAVNQENGFTMRLLCPREERIRRLIDRDGIVLAPEVELHPSEAEIALCPFNATFCTSTSWFRLQPNSNMNGDLPAYDYAFMVAQKYSEWKHTGRPVIRLAEDEMTITGSEI